MVSVEFQARVENGVIIIPNEYKQELAEASIVKVVVQKQSQKLLSQPDIMDELAANPIPISGIRLITREDMHER